MLRYLVAVALLSCHLRSAGAKVPESVLSPEDLIPDVGRLMAWGTQKIYEEVLAETLTAGVEQPLCQMLAEESPKRARELAVMLNRDSPEPTVIVREPEAAIRAAIHAAIWKAQDSGEPWEKHFDLKSVRLTEKRREISQDFAEQLEQVCAVVVRRMRYPSNYPVPRHPSIVHISHFDLRYGARTGHTWATKGIAPDLARILEALALAVQRDDQQSLGQVEDQVRAFSRRLKRMGESLPDVSERKKWRVPSPSEYPIRAPSKEGVDEIPPSRVRR